MKLPSTSYNTTQLLSKLYNNTSMYGGGDHGRAWNNLTQWVRERKTDQKDVYMAKGEEKSDNGLRMHIKSAK